MQSLDTILLRTVLTVVLAQMMALSAQAGQTASQIERDVEQTLSGDRDLRQIDVSVAGNEVTLGGDLPHLFAKNRAIERTLDVDGVETVVSELTLPEEEEDSELAQQIGRAINRYAHYTLWDHIDGRVNGGVVTLYGSVTPDRDKKGDLYEKIAKIKGVQDYDDQIEIQSVSGEDARLRSVIGRRLVSNIHFERTVTMRTPPFHIVVNRGSVTLVGYVQTQIEYHEMEQVVRFTQGVLQVDNQLQIIRE